jgi:paraquat-inducible protein B
VSEKANPARVGSFVVGAVILFIGGLVAFGSGRCFQSTVPVMLYFEGNVNGLDVGAPVKFRGVEVGRVTQIRLRFEPAAGSVEIPVLIELDQRKLESAGVPTMDRGAIERAVENGLRARLETQSLLTGLLFVQLDFYPDQLGHMSTTADGGLVQIPTLPTALEEAQNTLAALAEKLGEIDFAGLIDAFRDAAVAVRELAGSGETESTIASINQAVKSVQRLTDSLNQKVGPVGDSLRATSQQTEATVKELESVARSARELLEPESPLAVRLSQALQEITAAARSLRTLADSLERDPSAIVRGRSTPERKQP